MMRVTGHTAFWSAQLQNHFLVFGPDRLVRKGGIVRAQSGAVHLAGSLPAIAGICPDLNCDVDSVQAYTAVFCTEPDIGLAQIQAV